MRFKVGIEIHKSKALFMGHCHPYKILIYNLQKKIQRLNGLAILDGLHNSRCGSFRCVPVIVDDAKSALINTQGFYHFLHFCLRKTYSRITESLLL